MRVFRIIKVKNPKIGEFSPTNPFISLIEMKSGVLANRRFYPGERELFPGTMRGCLFLRWFVFLLKISPQPLRSFIRPGASRSALLSSLLLFFLPPPLLFLSGPFWSRCYTKSVKCLALARIQTSFKLHRSGI